MIEIRNTKGKTADLAPDTSIAIEQNNPLFNDSDQLFQDITYPFKMPNTENNIVFFDGGHLVEAENDVYEMEVQVIVSGSPFYAGLLSYSFIGSEYNSLLKVNLGAISEKIKTITMCNIYTDDADPTPITPAFMKTVCQNPGSYPFSFFPIYNENWDPDGTSTYKMVNNWDHPTQTFSLGVQGRYDGAICVYWKLSHYLKNLMSYLGFKITGGYFDDPDTDTIYIYTKRTINAYVNINGSMTYLPQTLTIADFLITVKQRFNICFIFNILNGSVYIASGSNAIVASNPIDLSDYVSSIDEISIPSVKGYKLTLTPDAQDSAWLDPVNTDQENYIPTNSLIIGSGEKVIELNSSTLKQKVTSDYTLPTADQVLINTLSGPYTAWPLRFIKYSGMKTVANQLIFPSADPMELNETDALWYRFLNDSKAIKLSLFMPPYLLSKLDTSQKIGFISETGLYSEAIAEKFSYQLSNDNPELIKVKLECRRLATVYSSPVSLISYLATIDDDTGRDYYKAYFLEADLDHVEFELYYAMKRTGTSATEGEPFTHYDVIEQSTDSSSVGGSRTYYPYEDTVRDSLREIRIRRGIPKYIVQDGVKKYFLQRDGYYYVENQAYPTDGQGIWIVF